MEVTFPALSGTVRAVCIGTVAEIDTGRRTITTAFVKQPSVGRVELGPVGLAGDEHVYEDHGGPDMALLAYPYEHYSYWTDLGLDLSPAGAMGENLTTTGLLETEMHIGDIYDIGSARIQVSETRSPCFKLAARYGRKDLAVLMQDSGRTGVLFRVLECGEVGAGDTITLVWRDDTHAMTVAEAGRIMNVDRGDLAGARRLFATPGLGLLARRTLATRISQGAAGDSGLHVERVFLPDDVPNIAP